MVFAQRSNAFKYLSSFCYKALPWEGPEATFTPSSMCLGFTMSCYLPLASFWFLLRLCIPTVRSSFILFHFFLFLQTFFNSVVVSVSTSFPNAAFASIQCTTFCTLPFPLRLFLSPALPFRLLCHCLLSLPLSQLLLLPLTALGEGRCGQLKRGWGVALLRP